MAKFTYHDWVPGRSILPKFKKLVSYRFDANVKDVWLIDQPEDKDWPGDNSNSPSPNETRLLPAANLQFKFSSHVFVTPDSSASASASYLISIGTGGWILDQEVREGSHFENEEFRCIITVKTRYLMDSTDPLSDFLTGGGIGSGRQYPSEFQDVVITSFYITKYDNSEELQNLVDNFVFPYRLEEFRFSKNRVISRIPEAYSIRESSGFLVGEKGRSQELYTEFIFPMISLNESYSVEELLFEEKKWGPLKSGVYFPIVNPNSKIKVTLIEQRLQASYISNANVYLRALKGIVAPYSRMFNDSVFGYTTVTYSDTNKNILLKTAKDGEFLSTKLIIDASDIAAGYNGNIIYKPDGKIRFIWEKSGNKFLDYSTLTGPTGSVNLPLGGIKTMLPSNYNLNSSQGKLPTGIWEAYIDHIDFGSTGKVWFSETGGTGSGLRWEIPLVMDGSNPTYVCDETTGVDYLFYWRRWRFYPEDQVDEDSNEIITRPYDAERVTLGAIYCIRNKNPDIGWETASPILLLPVINDKETEIPQQTVGVAPNRQGAFFVSWVNKNGELKTEKHSIYEKVSTEY